MRNIRLLAIKLNRRRVALARATMFVGIGLAMLGRQSFAATCPHAFVGDATQRLLVMAPATDGTPALWSPSAYAKVCDEKVRQAEIAAGAASERHIVDGDLVPLDLDGKGMRSIELLVGSAKVPAAPNPIERRWIGATSDAYLFVSTGVANLSGNRAIGGSASPSIRSLTLPAGRWSVRVYRLDAPEMARRDAKSLYPPRLLVAINPETDKHAAYRTSAQTFDASSKSSPSPKATAPSKPGTPAKPAA